MSFLSLASFPEVFCRHLPYFGRGVLRGIFMATDMVTSLLLILGKSFLHRLWLSDHAHTPFGAMPEGVTFGILLMNGLTPLIDNLTIPRKFGEVKQTNA